MIVGHPKPRCPAVGHCRAAPLTTCTSFVRVGLVESLRPPEAPQGSRPLMPLKYELVGVRAKAAPRAERRRNEGVSGHKTRDWRNLAS